MPFWAQYAALFHEDSVFEDIAHQFAVIERHVRDPKSGLLYHGWDESGSERWAVKTADVTSGHSPSFWGRAMGWYGMALADALEYFPAGHPGRDTLMGILGRYAEAVRKAQDGAGGVWWDVLDKAGKAGNFPEASATAMCVYTLARGVREGCLPSTYEAMARSGYLGMQKEFMLIVGHDDYITVAGSVGVSGLGGSPYRDGSYSYYTGEKVADNDPKGVGAVLLAAVAVDELKTSADHGHKTVVLDYYFNNERRKDITGVPIRYHYTWEDCANSGFSLWGHLFRQYGAHTDSLPVAPTADNLKKSAVYIIVDPDDDREVPDPHYLMSKEIGVIEDWVKAGGVLVLMSNDSANAEFEHFNVLAATFGIQFNFDDYHKVIGNNYAMGAFEIPGNDTIFMTAHKVYIKELSTLRLRPPAGAHFTDGGHAIMAVARVGKGKVFAVGDPWFYNEYTDGRKLTPDFENYNAARDLVQWLLRQAL
jgi:unsaturated rhamnogalacturonyl hydrolase